MIMAYWNSMKWEVSSKQIAYLEGLTTAYSIDTDTNSDKEGKKPTEEVGKSLIEIAFNTTYRVETGTSDIKGMLKKWDSMIGKTAPLIIGNTIFGPDKMQLQSVNVSNVELSPKGVMRAATLSFKFKEFAEEPAGIKKKTVNGSTTTNTAVSVGASNTDKTTKKTVSINNGSASNVTYMPSSYYLEYIENMKKNTSNSTSNSTHTSSSGNTLGGGGSSRGDGSSSSSSGGGSSR